MRHGSLLKVIGMPVSMMPPRRIAVIRRLGMVSTRVSIAPMHQGIPRKEVLFRYLFNDGLREVLVRRVLRSGGEQMFGRGQLIATVLNSPRPLALLDVRYTLGRDERVQTFNLWKHHLVLRLRVNHVGVRARVLERRRGKGARGHGAIFVGSCKLVALTTVSSFLYSTGFQAATVLALTCGFLAFDRHLHFRVS
jgi:hypothetical protein